MEVFYSTAIRVSELADLDISDVRFREKDLIVFGKGGKERVTYLNDTANLYLREYLDSRTDDDASLFVSNRKPYHRLTDKGLEYIVRMAGKRAEIGRAYPHKFRRTSLTNASNRGMPLQEVMMLAGHKSPNTTMRYCTVDQESVKMHHKKYLSA